MSSIVLDLGPEIFGAPDETAGDEGGHDPVLHSILDKSLYGPADESAPSLTSLKQRISQDISIKQKIQHLPSSIQAKLEMGILQNSKEALVRIHSAVLDSFPHINPHLKGAYFEKELEAFGSDLQFFLEQDKEHLSSEEIQHLEEMVMSLKTSSRRFHSSFHGQSFDLASLKPSESMLIPFCSNTHAMLALVSRDDKDQLIVEIIDTQTDGSIGASLRALFTSTVKDKVFVLKYDERVADKLSSLLCAHSSKEKTKDQIFQEMKTLLIKVGKGKVVDGREHHIQERGSCVLKVMQSYLKGDLIKTFGLRGLAIYRKFKSDKTEHEVSELEQLIALLGKERMKILLKAPSEEDYAFKLNQMLKNAKMIAAKRKTKASGL